jgi:hypothetical protein
MVPDSSAGGLEGSGGFDSDGGATGTGGTASGGSPSGGGSGGLGAGGVGAGGIGAGGFGAGGFGAGGFGAGGFGAGGSGGGGSNDCATLRARVNALLAIAQSCDPDSDESCEGSVDGECCDVVVDDPDSRATKEYLDALDALLKHPSCLQFCPAVLCPVPGPGTCAKLGDSERGRCRADFGVIEP